MIRMKVTLHYISVIRVSWEFKYLKRLKRGRSYRKYGYEVNQINKRHQSVNHLLILRNHSTWGTTQPLVNWLSSSRDRKNYILVSLIQWSLKKKDQLSLCTTQHNEIFLKFKRIKRQKIKIFGYMRRIQYKIQNRKWTQKRERSLNQSPLCSQLCSTTHSHRCHKRNDIHKKTR